ncbi:octanoyltransferase [Arthrobacter alpinus]|uniref:Octanoyltransferase n=2 Tax=Arthrobacter TaxID=1663 RepID=A0A0M5LX54_9MICC|nr:lipoyl(octanoyl) transferase LipB [Arthrobacter alpinus]ALE91857.1 octanoyltransferase [Arthrobacter alpinus]
MTVEFTEVGFAPNFIDYSGAWAQQRKAHDGVVAGAAANTVLLLEHSAVYTAGKRTEDNERPFDGTPVVNVDRGGKLTWHGPGQLVMYPIVRLKDAHGIREYVHTLEKIIIETLAAFGVKGVRVEGRAGIWLPADATGSSRKIAAIGIRVHDGVTMHGIAINANNDLAPYAQIIACGITDAGTTTIAAETGNDVTPADLLPTLKAATRRLLPPLIVDATESTTDIDSTPAGAAHPVAEGVQL